MPGVQETVNITDIYLSIMYIVNRKLTIVSKYNSAGMGFLWLYIS